MSIYAYVGLPGSGKSYGVVANQILPALKLGRTVVTNLPVRDGLMREMIPGADIRTFQTSEIAETPERIDEVFPPGCVAVIDELWRLWPAGLKVDKIPPSFKSFLAEHRHRVDKKGRALQIVFVTQDLAQIAAFARLLVEQTFHHKQLGAIGMNGKYAVSVYDGNVTGPSPPESKRISKSVGTYKADVWRFYESHTMKEGDTDGADERAIDGRGNVWRRPVVWLGMAAALAGLAFGGSWVYKATRSPGAAVGGGVATRHGAPIPAVAAGVLPAVQAQAAVWRVTGYLRDSSSPVGGYALVSDGSGHDFVPLSSCTVSQFRLECDYKGQRLAAGPEARARGEPIAPYDSSGALPRAVAVAP